MVRRARPRGGRSRSSSSRSGPAASRSRSRARRAARDRDRPSPAMLAVARGAGGRRLLELRLGDMRDLDLEEPATLVICPFRSLLHLPTWADRRRVFERVAASLRPGGRFALERVRLQPAHRRASYDGLLETREPSAHIRYARPRTAIDIVAAATGARRAPLWWATKSEWHGLVDVAGLEVEALYGGFAARAVRRRVARVRVRRAEAVSALRRDRARSTTRGAASVIEDISLLCRGGARRGRPGRRARRRHGTDRDPDRRGRRRT